MTERPRFAQRLRERKLAQWALAYLAGAWALLQGVTMAAEAFAWPDLVVRAAWVLLPTGFLIVLVLAWYHGEKGQQRASGVEILMLAALLAVAGAALVFWAPRGGSADDARAAEASAESASGIEEASVVVLPFADLSPGQDQEYFADGLTEEILNALARIPELRVPARTTSFSFKGKNLPAGEIARQLRVAHVLEGSVRKDAQRLRITAKLVDARDDRQLWSEQYDRELADVFAVQAEIAKAVAAALEVRLARAVGSNAAAGLIPVGPSDPAAYESYLRGLHAWNRRTLESLTLAVDYYQDAVQRDSDFSRAWAGLALTYVLLPEYADTLSSVWTPSAREAARRALSLDPKLAEAHTALGYADFLDGDGVDAESAFRRAIEVNPSFATAHQWYGSLLTSAGRSDEALQHMQRAFELDPLSFIINANLGDQLYYARQFDRALARYDEALSLNPEGLARYYQAQRAVVLLFLGREQEAVSEARDVLVRIGDTQALSPAMAGYVLARTGQSEAADLARRLEERARRRYVSPTMRAVLHVGLGETERAITLLEEAERTRDPQLRYYIATDPIFDPVRGDPRIVRIVERFRIPRGG